jgi:hypothetical protein
MRHMLQAPRTPPAPLAALLTFVTALAACSSPDVEAATAASVEPVLETVTIDFQCAAPGMPPAAFTRLVTGGGTPGEWIVEHYPGSGHVLAQRSLEATSTRFPLCILDDYAARDASLSVRFLTVSGDVDRAAGLVARMIDADNYLVVRANALEDNVRLYTVVNGERSLLAGVDVEVSTGKWHELRLDARGPAFAVFIDGRQLFVTTDVTFTEPGRIGLWTKADSVTRFDDLRCGPLLPDSPLRSEQPR